MWEMTAYILGIVACLGIMAWFVVHVGKDSILKPLAVAVLTLSLPLGGAAFLGSMGHPLPIYPPYLELEPGEYEVLGFKLIPNKKIYLLFNTPGENPPEYRSLPWDKDAAEQLQNNAAEGHASVAEVETEEGVEAKNTDNLGTQFEFTIRQDVPDEGEDKPIPAEHLYVPEAQQEGSLESLVILAGSGGPSLTGRDLLLQAQAGGLPCWPRDETVKGLAEKYGEVSLGIGYIDSNGILELFVSENGTWTILVTDPNGVSCILGSGTDWSFDKRSPKDKLDSQNAPPA